MKPKIIKSNQLNITGITGDGSKTGDVWNEFERKYTAAPFDKAEDCAYEIRFWDGDKHVTKGKDVHIGFATDDNVDGFTTVVLPEADYAVFDVYVAKGYENSNEEMDKWLADNSSKYDQLMLDGIDFVIECYNEKFKGGDQPDSIVEMWIPICEK